MFLIKRIDAQILLHSYNGISLSKTKESNNIDQSNRLNTEQARQGDYIMYDSIYLFIKIFY